VNAANVLRLGDRGDAVRDLRARLADVGIPLRAGSTYDEPTRAAVRSFQEQRGLHVDGVCGPETWGALVESGFQLGDRLLLIRQPMMRGDDVTELQRCLNQLGFDAGRADGILGPETEAALRAFQRNAGINVDGVCGPMTLRALARVGALADGSVATVRERDSLRRQPRRLHGERLFVAADPELAVLAEQIARTLRTHGAIVALDTTGDDSSTLAEHANRFDARAFIGLSVAAEPGAQCFYFANAVFHSAGGSCLATRLSEALAAVGYAVEPPAGRTFRILRETRMAAVSCELISRGDARAMTDLAARLPAIAGAMADGIRRGIEEPVDVTG
jgi:N-acetylmuramoyl-L-alanine amidase